MDNSASDNLLQGLSKYNLQTTDFKLFSGELTMSDDEFETTSNCSKTSKGDEKFAKRIDLKRHVKSHSNNQKKVKEN